MNEMIKNNNWLPWVLGGLVGLVLGFAVSHDSTDKKDWHKGKEGKGSHGYMQKQDTEAAVMEEHSQMGMDQMTKGLQGLTGDAFDKAFIEMMIAHHQGAVDMAKLIPTSAKHEELKKLGADIVTTQTKEIEMMKGWLKTWGYEGEAQPTEDPKMMQGMDHSKMNMQQ